MHCYTLIWQPPSSTHSQYLTQQNNPLTVFVIEEMKMICLKTLENVTPEIVYKETAIVIKFVYSIHIN